MATPKERGRRHAKIVKEWAKTAPKEAVVEVMIASLGVLDYKDITELKQEIAKGRDVLKMYGLFPVMVDL